MFISLLSYRIVGDNVDHMTYARIQSKEQTNKSVHWTHQFAVMDRIQSDLTVPQKPQKKIKGIQLVELLPVQDVQQRLKSHWAVLVSRVVCKFLQPFKHLEDVVVHHIPHPYTAEMSKKSASVSRYFTFPLTLLSLFFYLTHSTLNPFSSILMD